MTLPRSGTTQPHFIFSATFVEVSSGGQGKMYTWHGRGEQRCVSGECLGSDGGGRGPKGSGRKCARWTGVLTETCVYCLNCVVCCLLMARGEGRDGAEEAGPGSRIRRSTSALLVQPRAPTSSPSILTDRVNIAHACAAPGDEAEVTRKQCSCGCRWSKKMYSASLKAEE